MMTDIDYIGKHLDETECDYLALCRVSATLLRKETQLVQTAWFDYRLLHPTKRTYLFAYFYEQAYRYMIRRDVDYEQVEGDRPRSYLPKADPLDQSPSEKRRKAKTYRNCTSLWKARQKADECGIPYDIFCMSAMKAATERIWQRIPTPQQFYSEHIIEATLERWIELLEERLFVAHDEFYQLKNWQEHPSQCDHAQFLIEQISRRANPEFGLAQYGFKTAMIPAQSLRSHFSAEVLSRALILSKHL